MRYVVMATATKSQGLAAVRKNLKLIFFTSVKNIWRRCVKICSEAERKKRNKVLLVTANAFTFSLVTSQWRSQRKTFLGGKNFGVGEMFDFRRATLFLFGTLLLKTRNDSIC